MSDRSRHDPVGRLNDHHADDVAVVARAFGGHPDAISARAEQIDLEGVVITVQTPRGPATTRISFAGLLIGTTRSSPRVAFRNLADQSRALLARAVAGTRIP